MTSVIMSRHEKGHENLNIEHVRKTEHGSHGGEKVDNESVGGNHDEANGDGVDADEDPEPHLPEIQYGKAPRRVKVYLLRGDNWLDSGTGYCKGEVDQDSKKPYFIVRNELNGDEVILKSFLEGTTQYQRQQETLIVWTDPSGKDLALSFQETEGCADLCDFIIKAQQNNYSPEISLYYVISNQVSDGDFLQDGVANDITELITGPITFPDTPDMNNLEDILEIINQNSMSTFTRISVLKFIVENEFIPKLIELFYRSEQEKNIINLYALSEIIKNLITYNETEIIYEFITNEQNILGIIGILEYDAEFPNYKACHRSFLQESRFKTVIDLPVKSNELDIFKTDYYLNFLKDVALAKFLDDQSFNLFNSIIHMNQIRIIEFLKDSDGNDDFLNRLFKFYTEDDTDSMKKREGVKLLHQYVTITKNLQSYQRTEFFTILIKTGLFNMIKFALHDEDLSIRTLGTELIVSIIDQDVSLVNTIDDDEGIDNSEPPVSFPEHDINDHEDTELRIKLSDDMTLISLLSDVILRDKNYGLKIQAFEALKTLLDSNIGCSQEDKGNDISTEDYFKAFYNEVAPKLYQDIIEFAQTDMNMEEKVNQDEPLYQQLCELFSYCILVHDKGLQRSFFIDNNVLLGVMKLLEINCRMTLKLSAIRCLSNVFVSNDKTYYGYINNHNIIDKFFKFFMTVVNENNLANSTCLSLLENLQNIPIKGKNKLNIKWLLQYINDNYRDFCVNRIGVGTGKALIKLYDSINKQREEIEEEGDDTNNNIDASTPIQEDSPKITNIFEDIEKDLQNTKRNRDGDESDSPSSKKKVGDKSMFNEIND